MSSDIDDGLMFLFEYSLEENLQLAFRTRLEQERARLGISQSEWMCNLFWFDHNGQSLDVRHDPRPAHFPVKVKLRRSSSSSPQSSLHNASQEVVSSLQATSTRLPTRGSSDPIGVYVYVLYVGRSNHLFRDALHRHREHFEVIELPGPGAKLIVRPDSKQSVIDYFQRNAHTVQSRPMLLRNMKPWHVIVEDCFREIVESALRQIPSSQRVTQSWSPLIEVVDLTDETDATITNIGSTDIPIHVHASSSSSSSPVTNHGTDNIAAYANNSAHRASQDSRCTIHGGSLASQDHLLRRVHDKHRGDLVTPNQHGGASSSSSSASIPLPSSHRGDVAVAQREEKRLKVIDDETEIAETDIDEDSDDEGVVLAGTDSIEHENENATQAHNIPHEWINSVEGRSHVLERTFVRIVPVAMSEGRQTVSTDEGGRAPRRPMPPLPKSSGSAAFVPPGHIDTPSWPDSSPSMPSVGTPSQPQSLETQSQSQSLETPSQAQSTIGALERWNMHGEI